MRIAFSELRASEQAAFELPTAVPPMPTNIKKVAVPFPPPAGSDEEVAVLL